jgi:hypothetical protein
MPIPSSAFPKPTAQPPRLVRMDAFFLLERQKKVQTNTPLDLQGSTFSFLFFCRLLYMAVYSLKITLGKTVKRGVIYLGKEWERGE